MLGDVSGKEVPAAPLVSVLQGAIRSSMASQHERACERINRMLCERTVCERFATLFWGVFDPATSTLRYVNAGHAAPMLVRKGRHRIERLHEGGPVLGEAANHNDEEFGEDRIMDLISDAAEATPSEVCERIMNQVTEFASAGGPPDDRTLMVARFPQAEPSP